MSKALRVETFGKKERIKKSVDTSRSSSSSAEEGKEIFINESSVSRQCSFSIKKCQCPLSLSKPTQRRKTLNQ
ncbi:CLUMA_CG006644, isoform A [Clunio marinus]|uniref:CLUMA_CG006644, isoform A n=1 Tax=Clunio marinus TaxID=568069 RepID=A0A1J1HYF4_9DIPT|nr:CLUMA_CG006644, isoform A [Clunio marinus]